MVATIALVMVATFLIFRVIPGDPALIILGTEADEAQLAAMRTRLGLDRPLTEQFLDWVLGVLRGDLGMSFRFNQPVAQLIRVRLGVTVPLALLALTLVIVVAIPLGIASALVRGRVAEVVFAYTSQIGMAAPSFWVGLLLMVVFGVQLRWIPLGGIVAWDKDFWGSLRTLVLPAIAVALPPIAVVTRYVRAGLIDQLQQPYLRTALSKGLSFRAAIFRHALRNALAPVVTVLGIVFADIVAGTIIVEQVFSLPGVGMLLLSAVGFRELPLLQALTLYIAVVVVLLSFIVDLSYRLVDPRVRLR